MLTRTRGQGQRQAKVQGMVVESNVTITKLEFAYFTPNVKLYPLLDTCIIMGNEFNQFSKDMILALKSRTNISVLLPVILHGDLIMHRQRRQRCYMSSPGGYNRLFV